MSRDLDRLRIDFLNAHLISFFVLITDLSTHLLRFDNCMSQSLGTAQLNSTLVFIQVPDCGGLSILWHFCGVQILLECSWSSLWIPLLANCWWSVWQHFCSCFVCHFIQHPLWSKKYSTVNKPCFMSICPQAGVWYFSMSAVWSFWFVCSYVPVGAASLLTLCSLLSIRRIKTMPQWGLSFLPIDNFSSQHWQACYHTPYWLLPHIMSPFERSKLLLQKILFQPPVSFLWHTEPRYDAMLLTTICRFFIS